MSKDFLLLLLFAVSHYLTPFWKYHNTLQASATTDALLFTGLWFLSVHLILLLLKMMFLQDRGVEKTPWLYKGNSYVLFISASSIYTYSWLKLYTIKSQCTRILFELVINVVMEHQQLQLLHVQLSLQIYREKV